MKLDLTQEIIPSKEKFGTFVSILIPADAISNNAIGFDATDGFCEPLHRSRIGKYFTERTHKSEDDGKQFREIIFSNVDNCADFAALAVELHQKLKLKGPLCIVVQNSV